MTGKKFLCIVIVLLVILLELSDCKGPKGKYHVGKQGHHKLLKTFRGLGSSARRRSAAALVDASDTSTSGGSLWPAVFNLAAKASVWANATCGERGREEFCRLAGAGRSAGRCGLCDARGQDPSKQHPARNAVDGGGRWWQSPALHNGPQYEYVTVTVDLKQVYQIAYIILKAANSPRPGAWILERSLDGETYEPWQYFARTDRECLERFGIAPVKGKPRYTSDTEVICTSYFSKLTPLENGEVHISLVNGRPGANETSQELLEFSKARYVRFRFVGLRATLEPVPKWISQDIWKNKRLFYSIRDISIGGQCVCNGHAENCRYNVASGHPECECQHGTCGPNCDRCCPLFNQVRWAAGIGNNANPCRSCNCHGHAASCHFDQEVERAGLSLDVNGKAIGGGVCDECKDFTTGVNCEKCLPGYYRPPGVAPDASKSCLPCDCNSIGSTGNCMQYGDKAGICECKMGYSGLRCDKCAEGYNGYPECESCPCDPKGSMVIPENCNGECVCKANVDGKFCDRCKVGFFGLKAENPLGCLSCYCSGVTTLCEIAVIAPQKIETLEQWLMCDLSVSRTLFPQHNGQGVFSVGGYEATGGGSLYWLAPGSYLGNRLEAYGGHFHFAVQWVVMRGDTSGETTTGPNMVIIGENGLRMGYGDGIYTSQRMEFDIPLVENGWYLIPENVTILNKNLYYSNAKVSRTQFLNVLMDIRHILLRGTFHTDQIEALLEKATMAYGYQNENYEQGNVEKCSCPSGYTGLSCESCGFGYVRIQSNGSSGSERGFCGKCDCNGHSASCDPNTGECFCEHHTLGEKCERCIVGYYGNPFRGTPEDCKRCACPLLNDENNFSPSCQLDYLDGEEENTYVCTQCPKGYTGDHCEICDDGYFGNPLEIGNSCKPCDCNGGPCNRTTGQCLSCKGNTEGWKCERCKADHYGDPAIPNCKPCECDSIGSSSKQCNNITGQCECNERFIGRTCDRCEVGFGNVTALCQPCSCSPIGSSSEICDQHTGICPCQPGVDGFHCDSCQNLYYGFSEIGCKDGYKQRFQEENRKHDLKQNAQST